MGLDRWPNCGHKGAVADEEDDRSDWGGGLHRRQHGGIAQSPRRNAGAGYDRNFMRIEEGVRDYAQTYLAAKGN